jgi:hypothetical protein
VLNICQICRCDGGDGVGNMKFSGSVRTLLAALPLIPCSSEQGSVFNVCQTCRCESDGVDEINLFGSVHTLLAALPLIPRSGWWCTTTMSVRYVSMLVSV